MNFFRQAGAEHRTKLVVVLDFQNVGVSARNIPSMDDFIMTQLGQMGSSTEHRIYKAFARPDQQAAVTELEKLKWRVKEDTANLDEAIVQQSRADCGQDPYDTTLVICSKDGDFSGLVKEMQDWGVEVYLMGPPDTSRRLIQAVESGHWIQWPARFLTLVQNSSVSEFISRQPG